MSGESNTYTNKEGRQWTARPLNASVPAARNNNIRYLLDCNMWVSEKFMKEEDNRPVQHHPDAQILDEHGILPWLGKMLGEGAYGAVFGLSYTAEAKKRLMACIRSMTHVTLNSRGTMPSNKECVAVKIVLQDDRIPRRAWVQECYRESCILRHLGKPGCVLPSQVTNPVCSKDHVPTFFFSGMLYYNLFMVVMSWVPGTVLGKILKQQDNKLKAEQYVEIERAIAALWLSGVVHADLHHDNLMVDPKTKRVTIIDPGFAQLIPTKLQQPMMDKMVQVVQDGGKTMADVFTRNQDSPYHVRNLQPAINRLVKDIKGNIPYYNNDATFLRSMYKLVVDKARVPAVRRAVWGWSEPRAKRWWARR